ncbi:MAG: hypothetical protein IJC26_03625 [Clostridia bacterium]|nr:hypothetical protein [Clostridia bacterium]
MYEVIVLGATAAAAGIAAVYQEKCLVLERRMEAGYEFFGALCLGMTEPFPVDHKTVEKFQKEFFSKDSLPCGRGTILYPFFRGCHTLFGMETVSIENGGEFFTCTVHGVDGYRTYRAKRIVDTRCKISLCSAKSFNLLVESNETPRFDGILCEKADEEERYVLRCPVPLTYSFTEARKIALEVIRRFSPTQRLILSANEFDYTMKDNIPETENGMILLPSKAHNHPISAFEAGVLLGEEMMG